MGTLKKTPVSIALFLFFLSLYLFTMSGILQSGGETEKYRVAQSIVERFDVSIRPIATRTEVGTGGRTFSIYELGQSLVQVPFYVLARYFYAIFPTPDINQMGLLFVGLVNPILTALTCVALYYLSNSLGFQRRTSLAITLLYGLGTIAWAYSKNFDREPLLTLLILLSFHAAWLFRKTASTRWLIITGILAGFLVFTKFIQAMVLPFLIAYLWIAISENPKNFPSARRARFYALAKGTALFLLPTLIFLALQSIYALARFGTLYGGIGGSKLSLVPVILNELSLSHPWDALVGLLISLEQGFFVYSPPAILFLFTWHRWLRRQPREAMLLLGIVLIEFASSMFRWEWWGGPRWGPRYLVQMTPLLLIPIGVLENADHKRFWAWVGAGLLTIGAGVQMVSLWTNERDYADITGNKPFLTGQLDFLFHRALDSLVIYLSPEKPGFAINAFGVVLLAWIGLFAVWFARIGWQTNASTISSAWRGGATLVLVLAIESAAFLAFVAAPYPRILTAKANSQFATAEQFYTDGRKCEAAHMNLLAIERGTTYQAQALARVNELMRRAQGNPIGADELWHHLLEIPEDARVTVDDSTTISGNGSLKIFLPSPKDASIRAASDFIAVEPNQMYEISGWMKAENIYGTGNAGVTLYEDNGNWNQPRNTDLATLDETLNWSPFQKTVTTSPATRRILITAGLWNTFGTVWVDGMQVAKISAQNPPSANYENICK